MTRPTDSIVELHLYIDLNRPSTEEVAKVESRKFMDAYQHFLNAEQDDIYLEKICSYEKEVYSYNTYMVWVVQKGRVSNYFELKFPSKGSLHIQDKRGILPLLDGWDNYVYFRPIFPIMALK